MADETEPMDVPPNPPVPAYALLDFYVSQAELDEVLNTNVISLYLENGHFVYGPAGNRR